MVSKKRHVPVRTCIVCRQQGDKRTLTRIVKTPAGVCVDASGKMNGRGAYICGNTQCWSKAITSGLLDRALKTTLTHEERELLLQAMPSS